MIAQYAGERTAFWVNGTCERVNDTQDQGKQPPARHNFAVALRPHTVRKLSGVVCQKPAAQARQLAHHLGIVIIGSD
jgi:hypothetical protein